MPRFFFDHSNGEIDRDDEGVELPTLDAVADELRRTLPAILRDEHEDADEARISSKVRDAEGNTVIDAQLVLALKRVDR